MPENIKREAGHEHEKTMYEALDVLLGTESRVWRYKENLPDGFREVGLLRRNDSGKENIGVSLTRTDRPIGNYSIRILKTGEILSAVFRPLESGSGQSGISDDVSSEEVQQVVKKVIELLS